MPTFSPLAIMTTKNPRWQPDVDSRLSFSIIFGSFQYILSSKYGLTTSYICIPRDHVFTYVHTPDNEP